MCAQTQACSVLEGDDHVYVLDWLAILRGTFLALDEPVMNRPLRTVVLVSGREPQGQSLDALLVAASDYDVIFVESTARSYSCIKRVTPDLVIISSEVDDGATCQLLSMLKVDRRASGIPVLTCEIREHHDPDDDLAELAQDTSTQSCAGRMN
jgi:hypothetical protein